MLNIEKYRAKLENYKIPLDWYIREIREEENDSCSSKRCVECRKENIEWLLSEAQILDDAEKRYLKGVIRPFRKEVKSIRKLSAVSEWIVIEMKSHQETNLPKFKKGTMYQGMKEDKEYTLEELDL